MEPCHKTLTPPEGDQHNAKPVRVNVSSTAGKCAPMQVFQPEHGRVSLATDIQSYRQMTDDNPKKQFCLLMNINSAFEIMFPARNIQVRFALISQSCITFPEYFP